MSVDDLVALLPIEVWRGAARAWQCDEMGHLNASFYISQADEGLAAIGAALGIDRAARPRLLRPVCHHMRFLQEVRAATSLHMRAGISALREDGLRVMQVLVNAETDTPCAVIMTDLGVTHAGRPVASSATAGIRDAAERLRVSVPDGIVSQAIPDRVSRPYPDRALARELGLFQSAFGCFLPAEGVHGGDDVMVDAFIGRICDATRFLSRLFERTALSFDAAQPRLGTAALECRLDYLDWAKVGERFSIQSAFSEMGSKSSRRVAHWFFSEDDGRPLGTVHTLEVNFDLDQRRARAVAPEVRDRLQAYVVEALNPLS